MVAVASFEFGTTIDDATNERVQRAASALIDASIDGLLDVVPSYTVLNVEYDPRRTGVVEVAAATRRAATAPANLAAVRTITVPTTYDGPDLEAVAHATGLAPGTVADVHASVEYRVHALGFTPGFAFMASVDPRLRLPRRTSPRLAVPPCSVAIANAQTGVYPIASPGGWHVIGRSLLTPYDPWRDEPFLFAPGARVQFLARSGPAAPEARTFPLLPDRPTRPTFAVLRPGLRDLVVDAGRFGVARFGLARSGPIDPSAMADANVHVGNPSMASALEMALRGPTLRVLRHTVVGVAGPAMTPRRNGRTMPVDRPIELQSGDVLSFEPSSSGAVSYLALPGGIESTTRHGSASVDVRGRLGQPLRTGDVVGQNDSWVRRSGLRVPRRAVTSGTAPILRVVPGPHASPDALAVLDGAVFTVTASDRMGVRLDGPPVPTREIVSEPTELGAMQITTSGAPIVLLNDRGTLGGYAKPVIVVPSDLPRLAQARVGEPVRVRLVADTFGLYRRFAVPA